MKIIALQAENVKRLVAVEIRPDGNMVQITGKNGQGKTSVLDCIWWALSGATHIQAVPIRAGENQARIRLDLGEIVVTRVFKSGEKGNIVSSITVENAEGTRLSTPQTMIDKLLGELTFDPLAFARTDKRGQFETLRRFVPGVDFDAIDRANKEDYDKRTGINRDAKEYRVFAGEIAALPAGVTAPIDEAAIADELVTAGKHNTDIETRKNNRERMAQDAANKREQVGKISVQIQELQAEMERLGKEASEIDGKLAAAPALPAPIDVAAIRVRLDEAKAHNAQFEAARKRAYYLSEAEKLEAESDVLTKQIAAREEDKRSKIAAAKLPVPSLGFGEGEILLNGVPFNQGSDAEQLQASVAIAMALNPKLKVIRVRDGSLLDEDSLKILAKMADENDYQIWIERVDSSGKVGFVLEDGHIKGQATE